MNRKHRLGQILGVLLGTRIVVLGFLVFALYGTLHYFFAESLVEMVWSDPRIHGIILCSLVSIAAAGLINQFYDQDKDRHLYPQSSRWTRLLAQRYRLYLYLFLNTMGVVVASFLSASILIFFLAYQFLLWLYSHKLSRLLWLNNLSYVALSMYPFFGIFIYHGYISGSMLSMAVYLFSVLWSIEVLKDYLTRNIDRIFGYRTLGNTYPLPDYLNFLFAILTLSLVASFSLLCFGHISLPLRVYHILGLFFFGCILCLVSQPIHRRRLLYSLYLLQIWLFLGVLAMWIS